MELNANFKELKYDYLEKVGEGQAIIQCEIPTKDNGGIKKILSLCSDVSILEIDTQYQKANIDGRVTVKLIFINKEDKINSIDYYTDFNYTVTSDEIEIGMITLPSAELIDVDAKVEKDTLKLQAVVNIIVNGVENEEEKVLVSVDNGILIQRKDITTPKCLGKFTEKFNVTEQFESKGNVTDIFLYDAKVIACTVQSQKDKVILSGEITAKVIYTLDNVLNSYSTVIPFNEEIDCVGASESSRVYINSSIADNKIILSGSENKNIINFDIQLVLCAIVFEEECTSIINDLWSSKFDIEIERENEAFKIVAKTMCLSEKIIGSAELDDKMHGILRVLATNVAKNTIANTIVEDGKLTVEGLLSVSVIYEDDINAYNSLQVELPYSLSFNIDIAKSNSAQCSILVNNLETNVKREKEIEVSATFTIKAQICENISFSFIEEVSVGEEKNCIQPAISIYYSKSNDTLWDIAKQFAMPVSNIIEQNKWLSQIESIPSNSRIIAFRNLA